MKLEEIEIPICRGIHHGSFISCPRFFLAYLFGKFVISADTVMFFADHFQLFIAFSNSYKFSNCFGKSFQDGLLKFLSTALSTSARKP